MTDWFRSWHGAPTDPKWVLIARKARITPALASAIAWALFDHASQASPRGSVSSFDCEVYAAWGGIETEQVEGAINAMSERGMIVDGELANWLKRQPQREDNGSTDRVRKFRDLKRNETQRNANETLEHNEKRNETLEKDTEHSSISLTFDTTDNLSVVCPKPAKPARTRIDYSEEFSKFWTAFPTDELMSKSEAYAAWKKLSSEDRDSAVQSLPGFRNYCQSNPDYRPVHACRYLKQRRFEGFRAMAAKIASHAGVFIEVGTREWAAWDQHKRSQGGTGYPTTEKNGRRGWSFPSRFPPSDERMAAE